MGAAVCEAQELFVYSEPASNMATKTIGLRLNNYFMRQTNSARYNYQLVPEIMWGASKNIMVHAEAFLDNRNDHFKTNGGALYLKYRFLSQDEVHSHFRMAAYSRISYNTSAIRQHGIDLNGMNSGYELGVVATQLANKTAIAAGASFVHATNNGDNHTFSFGDANRNALAYNVSAGRLLLPKTYTDYDQTNLNFMLEMPGQVNLATGKVFLDLAPSAQLIFFSRMRLDVGYRFAIVKDLQRMENDGFLIRAEYNFFNVFR
jgi:hypothetical protein